MSHYLITLFFAASLFVPRLTAVASAALEDAVWERYQHAAKLYESGKVSRRLVELCKDLRRKTEDPILYGRVSLLLAQVLEKLGELPSCHKVLEDVYTTSRHLPPAIKAEARLRDAQVLVAEGRTERALGQLRTVAENATNSFLKQEARIALAWQYAELENWSKVDSLVNQFADGSVAREKDERVRVLQARSKMWHDQPKAAIELLEQSRGSTALQYLAEAYELNQQPMMAVAVFKKIHDLHPNTPQAEEALFRAGEVFMRSEDWLAARTQYNLLLLRFPHTKYKELVYFRLGWTYLNLDELDEAVRAFRKGTAPATQHHFTFMEAEALRRLALTDPSKYREAILKYNSIVALGQSSLLAPDAQFRAALTILETGSVEDAVISLRQFLALYPKSEFVPAANFLLATHLENQFGRNYFEEILQKHAESPFLKPALATLQKGDYELGNYQDVINRQARIELASQDTTSQAGYRELHLILAESAYYLKQYEQARQEYHLVRVGNEDDLSQKAALGEAWCHLQAGELDSAALAFTRLRSRLNGSNALHAAFGLATAHYRMKQFEQAIQNYPSLAGQTDDPSLGPLAARSLFRIGESYFRLEYYTQAIETWETLVQNFPESEFAPEGQFKIADTYFLANHFEEAIAAFSKIQEDYPEHNLAAESMLKTAQSRFNAGQYSEAITDFQKFVEEYPDHRSSKAAIEGIQLCYYQLGQSEQASEALEKLIEQAPNDMLAADARFRLAQTHLDVQEYAQAIQSFKEILTGYPGTSYARDAQFALAQAYLAKGEYPLATAEFARFIQYFPSSQKVSEALFQLAVGYFNEQSYLNAIDHFKRVVEEFPEGEFYESAFQNIGWCYDLLGAKEEALQWFTDYLKAFPSSEDGKKVKLQVAKMQSGEGNLKQAVAALKDLQSSANGDVATEASYNLGILYLESQDWRAAKQCFSLAVKRGPQGNHYRLSAMSQLAALYETEQDWQGAVTMYQMLTENASDEALKKAAEERLQALTPMLSSVNQND